MASAWSAAWEDAWGSAWGVYEGGAAGTTAPQSSGGYFYLGPQRRRRADDEDELPAGISPEVGEIIADAASRSDSFLAEERKVLELEIELRGLEWKAAYWEEMVRQRQKLLTRKRTATLMLIAAAI